MCAKNVCECPNPPGGYHSCPAGHVAVCRLINGTTFGDCFPASGEVRNLIFMSGSAHGSVRVWLLAKLFPKVDASEYGTRFEADFLGGRIVDRETGEIVKFSLPGRGEQPGPSLRGGREVPKLPIGVGPAEKKAPERARAYY